MVSYYPIERIDQCDEFCLEASDFEDSINLEYLDDAPLFCDDERLFRLSPNAETIIKPTLNMVAVGEELVRHLEL